MRNLARVPKILSRKWGVDTQKSSKSSKEYVMRLCLLSVKVQKPQILDNVRID